MRRWWRILRRRAWERQLDAELRFHMDEHVRELMAEGLSRAEAERRARHELGGVEQVKEGVRDVRPTRWLEEAWGDSRFAVRGLRADPGFAVVAIAALALGIGATTTIFSVAYPVLFEPLPYPEGDRLVIVSEPDSGIASMAFGTYQEVIARSRAIDVAGVFATWQPSLSGDGTPVRLEAQRVSASYFDVLGVGPAIGNGFDAADDWPGGPGVVMLSHALWRDRFGAATDIVGKDVAFDGWPYSVVGVMPEGFENVPAPQAAAWTLLRYDATLPGHETREWGRHLGMVARLAPDASVNSARSELVAMGASPVPEFARPTWASMAEGLVVRPLKFAVSAGHRPLLLTLLGAVGLLLAIACANVANLVLGRNARRRGELALRTSLGASRARVGRQLLVESGTLAGLGGFAGIVLAQVGVWSMQFIAVPSLGTSSSFHVDLSALLFALCVTVGAGLLVGLIPVALLGANLRPDLDGASTRATEGRGGLRRALVAAEIALSLVLLIGAALLTGSVQRILAVTPGFNPEGAAAVQIQVAGPEYREPATVRQFYDAALQTVRALPGVESAALTSQLPLSGDLDMYGVIDPEHPDEQGAGAYRYAVSPSYFETMGIELVRGRVLAAADVEQSLRGAVISETAAANLFADEDPLGRELHFGRTDVPPFEVIGVVRDVKQTALDAVAAGAVYVAFDQWYFTDRALWLVTRTSAGTEVRTDDVQRAVWSIDSNQPVVRAQTLVELVGRSESQRRFALSVFTIFATLAWVLAGIGLYGVVSSAVSERIRELGVRTALGASPGAIRLLVLRQGMMLTAIGVVIGLAGAAAASSAIAALLYEVPPIDTTSYLGTALAVAVVALAACWLPARRAAGLDPARVLRSS